VFRTGYVTAARIPLSNCNSFSWADAWPCTRGAQDNCSCTTVLQEASTYVRHLVSFLFHTETKPNPTEISRRLLSEALTAVVSCVYAPGPMNAAAVCCGRRGRGRKRKGWVSGHARGWFASQHAAFIKVTCWVINSLFPQLATPDRGDLCSCLEGEGYRRN